MPKKNVVPPEVKVVTFPCGRTSAGQIKILMTWAPKEFGPLQLMNSRWLKFRFFWRLSCSIKGSSASNKLKNWPGTGGLPQIPCVYSHEVGNKAPDWLETGMLMPGGRRPNVS